eukprot:7627690-Heterocapsa_arctica.AAC.1
MAPWIGGIEEQLRLTLLRERGTPSSRPVIDLTGIHKVLLKQCEMKEGAVVGTSPTPLLAAGT